MIKKHFTRSEKLALRILASLRNKVELGERVADFNDFDSMFTSPISRKPGSVVSKRHITFVNRRVGLTIKIFIATETFPQAEASQCWEPIKVLIGYMTHELGRRQHMILDIRGMDYIFSIKEWGREIKWRVGKFLTLNEFINLNLD